MKQFKMKSFAGALSVLIGICVSEVCAEVLHVGPGQACTDIASAITAANEGDTIEIDEGTYVLSAQLVVDKPITLKGAGPDKTFVDGGWDGTLGNKAFGVRCLKVNHAKAFVANLTLRNGYDKVNSESNDGVGLRIDTLGGTVSNCVITGCHRGIRNRGESGVYMNSTDAWLLNCTVSGNISYYNGSNSGDPQYGAGIMLKKRACD